MHLKSKWGMLVFVAMTAALGCSQSRSLIRGQSPDVASPQTTAKVENIAGQGPIIGSAPGYGQFANGIGDMKPGYGDLQGDLAARHHHHDFKVYNGFQDNNFGYEGGYYAGPNGYYTEHDRSYMVNRDSSCESDPTGSLQAGGAENCEQRPHGCPSHYQTYSYNWPQNMVYPNSQTPAGVVQYPYYTFRGPTDFFMK